MAAEHRRGRYQDNGFTQFSHGREEIVPGGGDRANIQLRFASDHAIEDLSFFGNLRIVEDELEHEAIELRFGQSIGALMFDRILSGEHHERRG